MNVSQSDQDVFTKEEDAFLATIHLSKMMENVSFQDAQNTISKVVFSAKSHIFNEDKDAKFQTVLNLNQLQEFVKDAKMGSIWQPNSMFALKIRNTVHNTVKKMEFAPNAKKDSP